MWIREQCWQMDLLLKLYKGCEVHRTNLSRWLNLLLGPLNLASEIPLYFIIREIYKQERAEVEVCH